MQATVWGGAGEHGRSCYLIEHRQTRILFDCGVKKEDEGIYPEFNESKVKQLDAVFLSHAHEDHSMALPMLYRLGYTGKVWTTRATHRQLPAYFRAWKQYVAARGAQLPFEDHHIEAIDYAFIEEAVEPGEWLELSPKLSVCWGRSGHLAGSIWLLLNMEGELVFYSGDYTAESGLLAADEPRQGNPGNQSQQESLCLAIVEAAYGLDRDGQEHKLQQLQHRIGEALTAEAMVLLPVPTYGRGQELMVWAGEYFPQKPIIVEQELMTGLEQLLQWREWLREDAVLRIERFRSSPYVTVVEDNTDRRSILAEMPNGGLVFTNDGMMQSAKCRSYYELLKQRGRYEVILTGHLAKGSFGDRLLLAEQRKETEKQRVHLAGYKVHQGLPDVRTMLEQLHSEHTILVHAGKSKTDALAEQLGREGFAALYSLSAGDTLELS